MDKNKVHIKRVSIRKIGKIIDRYQPYGRFMAKTGSRWVAVDNSTGDAWTEDFNSKCDAVRWLQGEFEVDDLDRPWEPIQDSEALIAAASKQGTALTEKEANVILGYLDGHDYTLMADGTDVTHIHDNQFGRNHRGDEPHSIQQAIEFCCDRNAEMQEDISPAQARCEEYFAGLKEDEKVLDGLMEKVWTYSRQEDTGGTVYTVVRTATDIDRGIFLSPSANVSYLSLAEAQAEMEREIAKEKALLDARYDHEERGSDYWEMYQDGYGAAGFSRIEILATQLHMEVSA